MWPPPLCPLDESAGPTDWSNWIIRPPPAAAHPASSTSSSASSPTRLPGPGLIAGAYPTASRNDPHATTVLLQSILLTARVTAFVSLLAEEAAGFVGYEQLAVAVCEAADTPRTPPLFLSLAIRDGHVTGDADVLELCQRLIGLLRDDHILYVHCWGGHGRTGTVIAIIIGLLYGWSGQQALDACSERHEQRRVWKGISSPQSPAQCRQVTRVLQHVQHGTPLTSLDPPPLDFLATSLTDAPTIIDRHMLDIPAADTAESAHTHTPHEDTNGADTPYHFIFTVMQWNTLASSLTNTTSFPHTRPQHLTTDHRRQLFVQELLRFSPTLICLQEVDGVDYEEFYYPLLASRHYDGLYVKKTGDAHQDGCALFYSTAHFAMLSCTAGPLSFQPKLRSFVSTPPGSASAPSALSASRLSGASSSDGEWSQVCIIAQFAAIVDDGVHPHHRIFVACTHLKAKEGNELTRTQQLHALTQQITQKLCRVRKLAGEVETSVIICGDFNDTPASTMWQLATAGQTTPTPATSPSLTPTTLSPDPPLCHSLWLHSLYDRYHGLTQPHSAYWTTVKRRAVRVQRVIDYVLYSPHTLLPLALCSVPAGVVKDEDGWPNAVYPSDHLALIGRFALIGQKMQRVPMAVHARHKL